LFHTPCTVPVFLLLLGILLTGLVSRGGRLKLRRWFTLTDCFGAILLLRLGVVLAWTEAGELVIGGDDGDNVGCPQYYVVGIVLSEEKSGG
jgi:hypothetical protein